jgi:hypothetical protein
VNRRRVRSGRRWWSPSVGIGALATALALATAMPVRAQSRLTDDVIPLDTTLTNRPAPPIEIGASFLNTGPLSSPIELPTGEILQPSFIVFGTGRTALQTFDDGANPRNSEWVNQLSIYGNMQFTGTERLVIGFRPFDNDGRIGSFFGQQFEPHSKFHSSLYGDFTTLFFEGDLSEIFPKLDPYDRHALDYGFSVGRQPLLFQNGMLLDDTVDSFGLIRNTILTQSLPPMRVTGYVGWNYLHRGNNQLDDSANLFAIDASADHYSLGTIDLDGAYVEASSKTGSGAFGAASVTNRVVFWGRSFNLTFRANGSYAINQQTPEVGSGVLLFGGISRTPNHTGGNFAYLNSFLGLEHFSSIGRRPDGGGPLSSIGILYEALGMDKYGSGLNSYPAPSSVGLAAGYQMFFDGTRRQVVIETGARTHQSAIALGGRLQQAAGQHIIFQFDSFVAGQNHRSVGYGARSEMLIKF